MIYLGRSGLSIVRGSSESDAANHVRQRCRTTGRSRSSASHGADEVRMIHRQLAQCLTRVVNRRLLHGKGRI